MNTGSDYLLIVEDDPDILKLLETTLTFRGYRVITARNGQEGLEVIQNNHPAIVIAEIGQHFVEGDQAGGSDDSRLAHAAAEHLAHPPRLGDRFGIAHEHRADRCTEAL